MALISLQDFLPTVYNYRKLPKNISILVRNYYKKSLSKKLKLDGDIVNIYSKDGLLLADSYDRIVVGDYGAFLEIDLKSFYKSSSKCMTGQEYRIKNKEYRNKVKYFWLTSLDEKTKIYFQQKTVVYADYKPNYIYVCPFEIRLEN